MVTNRERVTAVPHVVPDAATCSIWTYRSEPLVVPFSRVSATCISVMAMFAVVADVR